MQLCLKQQCTWRHTVYIDNAETILLFVHVHLCAYNLSINEPFLMLIKTLYMRAAASNRSPFNENMYI